MATDDLVADSSQVSVKLTTSKSFFAKQDGLSLTVTLTNGANHAVRLLRWETPVDGIDAPLFVVTRNGMPVDYIGRIYKRAAPRAEDYVVLAPGESLERRVDLAEAYDVRETGNYVVQYASGVDSLVSNEVHLSIEGRLSQREAPAPGANFVGCSASQQSDINRAAQNAHALAHNALAYLNSHTAGSPRYTTWFGAFQTTRHTTARDHFNKINGNSLSRFAYDCTTCTQDNVYAYVYPDRFGQIYLCPAFWKAPMNGTDSKSGTIVHEASHFNANGGTRDQAYGQTACRNLAQNHPNQTTNNADSHEYFAENNPWLN
ncbi:M35 family metallo-endopeptidase [Pendulispora rubella]|uniref:M35 family metallo-endopeptidase n=1 Tax=Pendulispora rubella TaxID=2741070 RepID=A0ABZ2L332_9BACT